MSFLKGIGIWNRFSKGVSSDKPDCKKETFKKTLKAFSLIELIISLIAISVIMAAFAPQISKRLSGSGLTIGGLSISTDCGDISDRCTLCDKNTRQCYGCTQRCNDSADPSRSETLDRANCVCVGCRDLLSGYTANHCVDCDLDDSGHASCERCTPGSHRTRTGDSYNGPLCQECACGYYCRDGKEPIKCPAGHYCPAGSSEPIECRTGTHARAGACTCTVCGAHEYSRDRAESCTSCSAPYRAAGDGGYNTGCLTCDQDTCKTVDGSGYYIRDKKSHVCSTINGCSANGCNVDGCTTSGCSSGYYMENSLSCKTCDSITNCSSCTSEGKCNNCRSGYYLRSNVSCPPCSDMPNCATCNTNGTPTCTTCNNGYYPLNSQSCVECRSITNCSTCHNNARSCTSCTAGHYMENSLSCVNCSVIKHCASCHHNNTNGCASCASGHTPLRLFNGKFFCTQYSSIYSRSNPCFGFSYSSAPSSYTFNYSQRQTQHSSQHSSQHSGTSYATSTSYNSYQHSLGFRCWAEARCNRCWSSRSTVIPAGRCIREIRAGYNYCGSPYYNQWTGNNAWTAVTECFCFGWGSGTNHSRNCDQYYTQSNTANYCSTSSTSYYFSYWFSYWFSYNFVTTGSSYIAGFRYSSSCSSYTFTYSTSVYSGVAL